jgi:TBC1 domain family member 5
MRITVFGCYVQVIESAFQQDRGQPSPFPNNILGGKGQVTAMSALTELRKISNLLREM